MVLQALKLACFPRTAMGHEALLANHPMEVANHLLEDGFRLLQIAPECSRVEGERPSRPKSASSPVTLKLRCAWRGVSACFRS